MATRMLQRRGTAAEFAESDPILGDGEFGWERDTDVVKVGDGVTAWSALTSGWISRRLLDAKGDLVVATADNMPGRLARGATGQRLTVQADGSLAWETPTVPTPPIPIAIIDALGDLVVGTGADTVGRLARGATGQRLTVNADGTLGWVNMPDLSVYETSAHAAATYETQAAAAATFETLADVSANMETKAHAVATWATIADAVSKSAAAQQVVAGAGGFKATNGVWDGVNRVYSAGNPPPGGGGSGINQIIRGTITIPGSSTSTTATITTVNTAKAQLSNSGSWGGNASSGRLESMLDLTNATTVTATATSATGNLTTGYQVTEWT